MSEQHWSLRPPGTPSADLVAEVGGHPLVAQLLAQRGYTTPAQARAFLDPTAYTPAPPSRLFGLVDAAAILYDAIRRDQNILVWGDFDVDGQTSTSLLVAALHKLTDPARIRFHVPNRFTESHGIKPDKLTALLDNADIPIHVILTCDTGIAEGPAIGLAKDRGLTVLVTDHHDLPPEFADVIPGRDLLAGQDASLVGAESVRRADALVNPKFQPVDDPLRTLPGVGVAYKLIQELYRLAGCPGAEEELLDLVALGIVADVAEQINDARYLLQRGLDQLRRTRRVGLLALMDEANLDPAKVDADSIGFQLGPRMNALGRLEDATVAVELLTTRDAMRAGQLAHKLDTLNQQRRQLTSQIAAAAMEMIERRPDLLDFNGLVLAHPAWHAGIVGIVASRLADTYNKPTVLLLNPPGQPARGSARSVTGIDIGGAIAACAPLLIGYGGHPGAAGLSLNPDNIDRFRRELSRQIALHRSDDVAPGLTIDADVTLTELSMELATELQRLAPFGQGNPAPRFVSRNLTIVEDKRMGREGTHRRLRVQDQHGSSQLVIWFNGADIELPPGPIDLVYQFNINEFRNERSLQLMHVDLRPHQPDQPDDARNVTTADSAPTATETGPIIHDHRNQSLRLSTLPDREHAAWYAEGNELTVAAFTAPGQVALAPRFKLLDAAPGRSLVIWSVPPSMKLLQWMVSTVKPSEIYLCGRRTTDDSLAEVLRRVAAMCKYALNHDGLLYLNRMAARLGTTEGVVRHGLLWMESRGLIRIVEWGPNDLPGNALLITTTGVQVTPDLTPTLQAELDEQLAEVVAFRRYFQRSKLRDLKLGA